MYPELFDMPFIHLTLHSYGVMMVVGFLAAILIIRRLSRDITPDPNHITNAALYSLIAGVFGARLFYVVHYFDNFRGNLLSVFAVWQGGLELLGGVILAISVIILYMWYHKLPIRKYLDILAIGLMAALAFGRIGCFLRGCCFGKPTDLPWAVCFPYNSDAYRSQVYPDLKRNRPQPHLDLPSDFFTYFEENGQLYSQLKPYEELTDEQKYLVDKGQFRCLPVHPTQLYSLANGAVLSLLLYLFWRRKRKYVKSGNYGKFLAKDGCTFALMFIFYGITRFLIEFLRDDNPFEFDGLTVSQNISFALVLFGAVLIIVFEKMKPKSTAAQP
ncbi:prolipoprotein diacylglyceryl transferase [Planctomycetota bacterium]